MITLIKELWEFGKSPYEVEYTNYNFKEKVKLLFKVLLLDFGLVLILSPLLIYLYENVITETVSPIDFLNIKDSILWGVLILPVIEELIFRLPLVYKHNFIAIFLNKITKGKFRNFWIRFYKYIFYTSVILFGLLHFLNLEDYRVIAILLIPILTISQLFGGFLLGFLRIKIGLIWSIIAHSSFNLTLFLIAFIFFHNIDLVNISNDKIEMFKITNLEFKEKDYYYFDKLEYNDTLFFIIAHNYNLETILDTLDIDNSKLDTKAKVNLEFRSKKGLTRDELIDILVKESILEK